MKKFNLVLLGLTAFMTVTGCNATESSTKVDTRYYTPISEVLVTRKCVSLLESNSYQIETIVKPFEAFDTPLYYSTSDKKVATVDKNGLITAKKAGHAVIEVTTGDYSSAEETPKLIDTVDVYVTKKIEKAKMRSAANKMIRYQQEKCTAPENVRLYDYRIYDMIRDGVIEDSTEEYQTFVVSKTHGLMSFDSFEIGINTTYGAKSYVNYGYSAYTSPLFGSFIYHRSEDVKKYYYAPTESSRGKLSRYETMCGVLDSMFSVENSHFTSCIDDIIDLSDLSDPSFNSAGLYESGDELYFYTSYGGAAPNYSKSSVEDEIRYAIQVPAGIPYDIQVSIKSCYVNGFQKELNLVQTRMFNWRGSRYQYRVTLKQSYESISDDEAAKYIPGDDYEQVDYYYDI